MGELFEALTLIQTGKVQNFPVILYDKSYWQGLFDWLKSTMLAQGKISPPDLDLLILSDSPEEIRDIIISCFQDDGWRQEQEESARQKTREVYGQGFE
jgi:predicted Rossmann-fold nucleotide-binding protein